ncbi:flagellar basal body rod protein FlgB [Sphaerotilus sp.]|jgi:flagellar basal-body rod protein FlgB|uniref:flagellar basal body rod protein FlgB n=1 Tax=Sphaerotilus sp. TaxID=2093942 RepID=UPI0025F4309D|nr:flagellar basal body rod protein FlgB [Sphaerotilus sp.]
MLNRLSAALEFQTQALTLRSERQRLIASNIANADTPGYQAREIDFGKTLRQLTGSPGGAIGAPTLMAGTDGRHLATGGTSAVMRDSQLLYAAPSQTNLDANTVDMDRERASFADNAVKYEAALRFINGDLRTMLEAIKGQ